MCEKYPWEPVLDVMQSASGRNDGEQNRTAKQFCRGLTCVSCRRKPSVLSKRETAEDCRNTLSKDMIQRNTTSGWSSVSSTAQYLSIEEYCVHRGIVCSWLQSVCDDQ